MAIEVSPKRLQVEHHPESGAVYIRLVEDSKINGVTSIETKHGPVHLHEFDGLIVGIELPSPAAVPERFMTIDEDPDFKTVEPVLEEKPVSEEKP